MNYRNQFNGVVPYGVVFCCAPMNVAMLGLFLLHFRRFFLEVSTVEEPENHFIIDEYRDVVMVTKPAIYISVQEICDTHTLLLGLRDEIAPDPNDPLRELLDYLGNAPSVAVLPGKCSFLDAQSNSRLLKVKMFPLFASARAMWANQDDKSNEWVRDGIMFYYGSI